MTGSSCLSLALRHLHRQVPQLCHRVLQRHTSKQLQKLRLKHNKHRHQNTHQRQNHNNLLPPLHWILPLPLHWFQLHALRLPQLRNETLQNHNSNKDDRATSYALFSQLETHARQLPQTSRLTTLYLNNSSLAES